jgi:photosystem II stability/assembly factor-like uncharacterized protein
VTLWHTADAGASWQPLIQPGAPNAAADNGIDTRQCKDAFSFVDARRGFLAAWDQTHPAVLYRTTDGGRTWNASAPLPDLPATASPAAAPQPGNLPGLPAAAGAAARLPLHPERVRAFGATLLLPVQAAGGGAPTVFRSHDGGVTWAFGARAPEAAASIGLLTATRWLQLSAPAQSAETTDAGATWHLSGSDYAQAAPIPPVVVFADPSVGYATVRGSIRRTLDGGTHWAVIPSPGTTPAGG